MALICYLFYFQLNYGSSQPPPGGSSYPPYGAPAASVPGYPPNTPAYGAAPNAPVMGGTAPPIGFNPLVLEGAGTCKGNFCCYLDTASVMGNTYFIIIIYCSL